MTAQPKIHDGTYRKLFSYREIVAAITQSFIRDDWHAAIRWQDAVMVSAAWVRDSDLAQRHGDVLWRLPCVGSSDLYLFLMVEFQSGQDYDMLRRLDEYARLFRSHYWAERQVGKGPRRGKLPRMLPAVLYTGEGEWRAPVSFEQVTEEWAPGLECLRGTGFGFSYEVVQARRLAQLAREPNVMECLLGALAAEQTSEVARCVRLLKRAAERLGNPHLVRSLGQWLKIEFARRRIPSTMDEDLESLWEEPERAEEMIGTFEDKWKAEGVAEGMAKGVAKGMAKGVAKGMAKGRAEGVAEGQRKALMRLISKRFGVSLAETVAPRIEAIRSMDALHEIFDDVAVNATPDTLLARLERV